MAIKRLLTCVFAIICVVVSLPCAGFAAQSGARLSFSITCDPPALSDEGDATLYLNFELTNAASNEQIELITATSDFSATSWSFNPSQISASNPRRTFVFPIFISDEMIGRSYEVTLFYKDAAGATQMVSDSVTITRAEPELLFTRAASATSARPGGVITVTYEVINTGQTTFTDIVINDRAILPAPYTLAALEPGESVKYEYQYVLNADTVSRPEISYSYEYRGEKKNSRTAESELKLSQQISLLDVRLMAEKTEIAFGESTTLWITVLNEGTLAYSGVVLEGEYLTEPIKINTLGPGETFTTSCMVMPLDTHEYIMTAKGTNTNGQPSEKTSEGLIISVTGAPAVDPAVFTARRQESGVTDLLMEARAIGGGSADTLTVEVLVRNPSSTLSGVRLNEKTLGMIESLGKLTGDKRFVAEIPAPQVESVFEFTLEAVDENGRQVMLYASCAAPAMYAADAALSTLTDAVSVANVQISSASVTADDSATIPRWLTRAVIASLVAVCVSLFAIACIYAQEFFIKKTSGGADAR